MMERNPKFVYLFTFILAFCSLFYELIYAQILSVCLGGTKNQYFIIIALFTCALGFGSILQARLRAQYSLRKTFFAIELLLTILGSVGPFFITWILQPGGDANLATLKVLLSYSLVFIIGFLSGFEIPCLFAMIKNAQGKILAFDYLGMLVASVSFPFFFLPQLGTAPSTLFVAGANALALVWLRSDRPDIKISILLYGICFGYFSGIIYYKVELNLMLSALYLGGP